MAMTSALSGDALDRAIALREQGRSTAFIKRVLNIPLSPGAIEWQLMRAGVYPPGRIPPGLYTRRYVTRQRHRTVRPFTPDEDRALLTLEREGKRVHEIAAALGRRSSSIRGRLLTLARYDALGLLPSDWSRLGPEQIDLEDILKEPAGVRAA